MNFDNIILIDWQDNTDLYPFSIMHNSWEMRVGCTKIYEKYELMFPEKSISYYSKPEKLNSFLKRIDYNNPTKNRTNSLMIKGNAVVSKNVFDFISEAIQKNRQRNLGFESDGYVFAYFIQKIDIDESLESIILGEKYKTIPMESHKPSVINYLWEALDCNWQNIESDLELLRPRLKDFSTYEGVNAISKNSIYLGENVKIAPGVVLDASRGPIIIDDNADVMPNAVILGPCYIGRNTIIKIGAKIYQNCSLGEYSKIGGELEATIVQAYSNKQHEGFLGHSYICEWVNLGADTNNSDLKNTYSNIIMRLPNKRIATDRMFIGLLAGDHTKAAINTQFTTGTVTGISCNLFDSGFLPSLIPSFAWGGATGDKRYRLDDALRTAEVVMQRRNKTLLPEEIELIRRAYKA